MEQASADYQIGGGWGNSIKWTRPEQFNDGLSYDSRFDCHGWKQRIPKVGSTIKAEMERSWLIFEFVEVKRCGDPPDMFFAVVKPIRQIMKDNAGLTREQREPGVAPGYQSGEG